MTVILGTILVRGDTAATWASVNPVLNNRELGLDETAQRLKVGDGVTAWNSLAYITGAIFTDEAAQDAVGGILVDTSTIDFTYNDGTPSITADVKDGSLGLVKLASGVLDTDGSLAANSDSKIASQKATKTYVDTAVTGVMKFKGVTDCSASPNYPAASKGDAYIVTVAGKIGGASGKSVDVGDVYLANATNAGGTEASVGASWSVLEHNLIGALLSANNLSDLASASTARTNLGLAIGTNVQAFSALLAAYAAAAWSAGVQIPALTAANTIALKTVGGASGNILDKAAGDALYQPVNAAILGAWTAYTPTVAAGVGAFTTVSATGRYRQVGKTVEVHIKVKITTNGSASSYWTVTAPVTSASVSAEDFQLLMARETNNVNNLEAVGALANNSTTIYVQRGGAYFGGDGYIVNLSGVYEAA